MKVLVANLGSTSFKYRLFDMTDERLAARGGVERIGDAESQCFVEIGGRRRESTAPAPDHAAAVGLCFQQLTDPEQGCLSDAAEVAAIGFKAVHGGRLSGVHRVTDEVLSAMEEMNAVAPAHNPPYIAAMRRLAEQLPETPLVACYETGFHATIPDARRYYAVPYEWAAEHHIRKWGFHGASHRYIAGRASELLGDADVRIVSCHLGGSSSLCAVRGGESVATSMGMSPQSGLPQNNRSGDFDVFALPLLLERTGESLEELLRTLSSQAGLAGLSGVGGDLRDLESEIDAGGDHAGRARLALDVYIEEIRRSLGGMLVALGGAEAIVFTGGIGENSQTVRGGVCRDLDGLGIALDDQANAGAAGEAAIHSAASRTQIWVVPTNEEIVVARQVQQHLQAA